MLARLNGDAQELLGQQFQGGRAAAAQGTERLVVGRVARHRARMLEEQRLQVVVQRVAHEDAVLDDPVDVLDDLLERPRAVLWPEVLGSDAAELGPEVGDGLLGHHVGVQQNLAVEVDDRYPRDDGLAALRAHADHFTVQCDVPADPAGRARSHIPDASSRSGWTGLGKPCASASGRPSVLGIVRVHTQLFLAGPLQHGQDLLGSLDSLRKFLERDGRDGLAAAAAAAAAGLPAGGQSRECQVFRREVVRPIRCVRFPDGDNGIDGGVVCVVWISV